jgi:3-hydroxyisobutyrate dehydrogenase
MLKDLQLAQDAAHACGAETALGAHAAEIYASFAEQHAGLDFSAIINAIRDRP